jgi:lysophospholipase L1-like esterase
MATRFSGRNFVAIHPRNTLKVPTSNQSNRIVESSKLMAIRACFFGDSFVNGVGDNQHLGWVGRFSAAESSRGADLTSYN